MADRLAPLKQRLREPYFVLLLALVIAILVVRDELISTGLMVLAVATLWVDWKTRPDRDPRGGPKR